MWENIYFFKKVSESLESKKLTLNLFLSSERAIAEKCFQISCTSSSPFAEVEIGEICSWKFLEP